MNLGHIFELSTGTTHLSKYFGLQWYFPEIEAPFITQNRIHTDSFMPWCSAKGRLDGDYVKCHPNYCTGYCFVKMWTNEDVFNNKCLSNYHNLRRSMCCRGMRKLKSLISSLDWVFELNNFCQDNAHELIDSLLNWTKGYREFAVKIGIMPIIAIWPSMEGQCTSFGDVGFIHKNIYNDYYWH